MVNGILTMVRMVNNMYSKVRSRNGAKTYDWAIVSNGQPNIGKEIHWEMGTENGWIGYTYGVDYGYMEFFEDGTVNIHRLTDDWCSY